MFPFNFNNWYYVEHILSHSLNRSRRFLRLSHEHQRFKGESWNTPHENQKVLELGS